MIFLPGLIFEFKLPAHDVAHAKLRRDEHSSVPPPVIATGARPLPRPGLKAVTTIEPSKNDQHRQSAHCREATEPFKPQPHSMPPDELTFISVAVKAHW